MKPTGRTNASKDIIIRPAWRLRQPAHPQAEGGSGYPPAEDGALRQQATTRASASYHTGVSKPATYSCRMETASGASRSERRRLHRSRSLRRVWCRRRLERGEWSEPRRRDEPAEGRRGVVATWKSAAYRLERGGRCLQATPEPARGLTAGCNSPTVPPRVPRGAHLPNGARLKQSRPPPPTVGARRAPWGVLRASASLTPIHPAWKRRAERAEAEDVVCCVTRACEGHAAGGV